MMTLTHKKYFPHFFSFVLVIGLTFLSSDALAVNGVTELDVPITAVKDSLTKLANPALWGVVLCTGIYSLIKQNLMGVGIVGVGAVALTQLSEWVTTKFTCIL